MHLTPGDRGDHRPDLHQVRLDLIVEPHAGRPLLMPPLRGNRRDTVECGRGIDAHISALCRAAEAFSLGAERALYRAANRGKLAQGTVKWGPRVPATLQEVQAPLAPPELETMTALPDGYRDRAVSSTFGGGEQRWLGRESAARQKRLTRTGDKQLARQSDQERKACKPLCAQPFAWEPDARQALAQCKGPLALSQIAGEAMRTTSHYGGRGCPQQGQPPARVAYGLTGALASSWARRQALVEPKRCFVLATPALEAQTRGAPEVLSAYKGHSVPERGVRVLKAPQCLASALSRKTPERIMALLMGLTVCLLVYAAVQYRLRKALGAPDETFLAQKGRPTQRPTARGAARSLSVSMCDWAPLTTLGSSISRSTT
jgi:transposase